MNDVKRYDCTNGKAQHCYGCYQMTEGVDGDYVESADFDRVIAERDALQLLLNDRDEQLHTLEQSRRAHFESGQAAERDAVRYRWLRTRNLGAIHQGGVFAGKTPENTVLNGDDLDAAIDGAIKESDDEIPDFSPGNGNKARRRAEAMKTKTFSDANELPCTACFVRGCNGECSGDGAMGD